MKKKSGLDDSPLFVNPTQQQRVSGSPAPHNDTSLSKQATKQDGEKERKSTSVQMYKRTSEQSHSRTDVQTDKRTPVQDFRPIKRNAYSLYIDQINFIEDEVLRRKRQTGKSVGISEVMREIVSYYISKKKK